MSFAPLYTRDGAGKHHKDGMLVSVKSKVCHSVVILPQANALNKLHAEETEISGQRICIRKMSVCSRPGTFLTSQPAQPACQNPVRVRLIITGTRDEAKQMQVLAIFLMQS